MNVLRRNFLDNILNRAKRKSFIRTMKSWSLGPVVLPSKEIDNTKTDFVNYNQDGLYFTGYSETGFTTSHGSIIVGPCAAFPRNTFFWDVEDAMDIDEDALSLFFTLDPKLDILLIGKGSVKDKINYRKILQICKANDLNVEILPTAVAVGVFNFLNWEDRYVGAALVPPSRLDVHDVEDEVAKRLSSAESELEWSKIESGLPRLRLGLPDAAPAGDGQFEVRQSPLIGGSLDLPKAQLASDDGKLLAGKRELDSLSGEKGQQPVDEAEERQKIIDRRK